MSVWVWVWIRPAPIMLQNLPIILLGTSPKRHLLYSHFILLFSNYFQAYALALRPLGTAMVGVVDLLVVLSDSAIESLLEVVIIHVQSYTWLYCRLGCAARGGQVACA